MIFWAVFVLLTFMYSLVLYKFVRNIFIVPVISALALTLTMQIVDVIQRGYLDEFSPIAVVVSFVLSLLLSLVFLCCFHFLGLRRARSRIAEASGP